MARFCGKVGFIKTVETRPGIWEESAIERTYYGDVIKNNIRWQNGESINDDFTISNQISIMADNFVLENINLMKYVEFMGVLWKISSISVERPRLHIDFRGEYHAE